MSAATESTAIPMSSMTPPNPWNAFSKYGLPGLVIGVLFFFMYKDREASREDARSSNLVIAENTKVQTEIVGMVREMKEALRENTEEIRKIREDRKNRR